MLNSVRKMLPFVKVNNSASYSASAVFKEQSVQIGKWNINYLKVGTGSHTVLCTPGAGGSLWTDYQPQIEGIDKEKFTIVAWDPPGFGKSRPPERGVDVDYFDTNADCAYKLMKALEIPKYSLLGWSDGGSASMILASKYPDVVNKLVLVSAKPRLLSHEVEIYKKFKDMKKFNRSYLEIRNKIYGEEEYRKISENWVDSIVGIFEKKNADICSKLLKNIKCPTLILHGKKDFLVDISHVKHMQKEIPDSRVYLYPDGKHDLHLNYPEDFNNRVQEFLLHGTSKL